MIVPTLLRLVVGLPCLYLWAMILFCNLWYPIQMALGRQPTRRVSAVPLFGSIAGMIAVFMIPDDRAGRMIWVWLIAFLPDIVLVPQFLYAIAVWAILKKKP